jgi:peptide/nickel transport system permease protein
VSALIAERFPATLELALVAGLIALGLGIPLGVYAALRRGRRQRPVLMTGTLFGVSLPNFVIGIVLIWVFAVELGGCPASAAARLSAGPRAC